MTKPGLTLRERLKVPWTVADVDRHKAGLTPKQKKVWVAIANAVLQKTQNEASAIRIANARAIAIAAKVKPKKGMSRSK